MGVAVDVALEENGRGYRVRGRGQYSWAWLQLLFTELGHVIVLRGRGRDQESDERDQRSVTTSTFNDRSNVIIGNRSVRISRLKHGKVCHMATSRDTLSFEDGTQLWKADGRISKLS